MRPCVHVLASDQRYAAIVTPGGPGPNLPKWPVMASSSNVTGRDPGPRVSAARPDEAIACRRPGPNPPKWPVMAGGSDVMPGRVLAWSAQRSGVGAGCGRSWEDLAQATADMDL